VTDYRLWMQSYLTFIAQPLEIVHVVTGVHHLSIVRYCLALALTVSLATAPLGAALAQPNPHVALPAANGEMDDCAKMMGHASDQSGSEDKCPCCDTKAACPPEQCLTKCFKVFSAVAAPIARRLKVAIVLSPAEPLRPPDWSSGPQPPPPRA
jgi:hypothetical protein